MTRDDTKKLIFYLKMGYPNFCDDKDLAMVVDVWFDALRDEETRIVSQAAKNYVKANEYPPTIAGIVKQRDMIRYPETDTDLWALIENAARNGSYNSVEEFNKLPPECQSFIGSPEALKDLAQADVGTMNTIVKGQFLKRVDAIMQHQRVQKGLPAEVKRALEESKLRMLMEGE